VADRVLVVEDDEAVRTLLRMLLEDEQLQVVEAATGVQAIERFDASCSTWSCSMSVSRTERFRRVPAHPEEECGTVIMVTAQNDSHDVVTGLELGADDYVTKPFNDRELLARVRVQLRRRATEPDDERLTFDTLEVLPAQGLARRTVCPHADENRVSVAVPPGAHPQPCVVARPTAASRVGLRLPRGRPIGGHARRSAAGEARGRPEQPTTLGHRARAGLQDRP